MLLNRLFVLRIPIILCTFASAKVGIALARMLTIR